MQCFVQLVNQPAQSKKSTIHNSSTHQIYLQYLEDKIIIIKWLIYFVYCRNTHTPQHSSKTRSGADCNTESTTSLKFGLWQRAAICVGNLICPCLKRACLGRDWLWLYFGETEQPGFLETGAQLGWRAGCSWWSSPERGPSSAGIVSTSKPLSNTWTQPAASGRWKKSDPLTTHTLKISLEERKKSLFCES